MFLILFSDEDDVYYLKIWYCVFEDVKVDENDISGDDNLDINYYYGCMEIGYGICFDNWGVFIQLRNNLEWDKNCGSVGIMFSYFILFCYEVVLEYFNGYGDLFIDYNCKQECIGVGVQFVLF